MVSKNQEGLQHFDFIGKEDFGNNAGELRLDGKDLLSDADFEIHILGNAPKEGDIVLL